ncbi:uncharacterized protein ccdc142 isoform X2 [Stigmatopora nigra]
MNWLSQTHSQDGNEEEREEGNFVMTCNLVSRSSAHILHLEQALLSVSNQRQHVGGAHIGSPKVCVKSRILPSGGLLVVPSSRFLNMHYHAIWKLLEQRSLLLFIHEYTRRAHLAAAYVSQVDHLLDDHLKHSRLSSNLTQHFCSSAKVHFVSLCQEFHIHLNHWSCLLGKVQSDHYLRRALAHQNKMLVEIKQTLHLLSLEAVILMDRYLHAVLFTMGQSDLDQIPREIMEDILTCLELYNTAMKEPSVQHLYTTHQKTKILQQNCSITFSNIMRCPAPVSAKDLLKSLAVHHAYIAASQLHLWTAQQCMYKCHMKHGISSSLPLMATLTWEQIQDKVLMSCSCFHTGHLYTSKHKLENHAEENHHCPDFKQPNIFLITDTNSCNLSYLCQKCICNFSKVQTDPKDNKPSRDFQHLERSPRTFNHFPTTTLSDFCQQYQSKVEVLIHLLVSSNDLQGPLISHPVTPTIQQFPLSETIDMLQTSGKTYPNKIIRDPSMDITQNKIVEKGTATEFAVYLSSHVQRGLNDVLEDVPKVDGCAQRSCSVQWSDLGQPMLFDKLSRQYSTLLWACCSKALALEMQHPHCARSLGSVNLSGNCRSLHIFEIMTQVLMADILPSLCKAMLEEFSLNVLISAAHAHWDYVVCRGLGASLNDKCLTAGDQYTRFLEPSSNPVDSVRMSMTVGYLLQLTPPLLSALSYCHASGSSNLWKIGQTFHRLTVSLTLTTIQLFTVWVMSKAYQFLSSWSLNKFFLITQGDLEVLRKSLDKMVQQTKSLMNSDCFLSTLHSHNEFILMEQLQNVDSAYAELQSLVG